MMLFVLKICKKYKLYL